MPRNPKGKVVSNRMHHRNWFNGAYYRHGQPWTTFAKDTSNREKLKIHLMSMVDEPKKRTALEIGAADSAVVTMLPFKKVFLMDRSHTLTKESKSLGTTVNAVAVTGDIRRLPFKKDTKFEVIVVNEVLTHLRPTVRIDAVRELTKHCNSMLLVDRQILPAKEIKRNRAFAGTLHMLPVKGETEEQVAERIRYSNELKDTSDWAVRKQQETLVNFPRIRNLLERMGWITETHKFDSYTMLKAFRKK